MGLVVVVLYCDGVVCSGFGFVFRMWLWCC